MTVVFNSGRFIGFPVIGPQGDKAIITVNQDNQKVKLHDICAGVGFSTELT